MSDIFKKIRSIEAEDDAITEALGLSPQRDDGLSEDDSQIENDVKPHPKPLNLSIPEDDGVLNLDDMALEMDSDDSSFDMPSPEEAKVEPIPSSRLGLTPIMPAAATAARLKPVGHVDLPPAQQVETSRASIDAPKTTPLPDFMSRSTTEIPNPEALNAPAEKPSENKPVAVKFIEHPKGENPYGGAAEFEPPNPMRRFITIAGIIAALIWIVCSGFLLADMLKNTGAWASMNAMQKLGFSVMAIFPLVLIGLATYAFRHLSALSFASDKLKVTAEAMMTPDDTVIARSTIMAKSIQAQVDEVNLKVSSALTRMELLDDMVKSQGSSLAKSSLAIETTTTQVEDRISAQRQGLESIANLFEGRMETLSHMMDGHTTQLASSGQMAEQRVQEARLSVESAAERIASASETVRQNAVAAAQTLSGSHVEITKLGDDVQAQSTRLDAVYRQHLNDLKVMLVDLREQQDELGATMEERLSKMRDMSLSAKVGAQSLTEASIKGRETVEALNEAATLTDTAVRARFSEMEEMVKYSTARAESISETATRQVQNSLSTTRKEIARIEADMMDLMDKLTHAEASKASLAPPKSQHSPTLRRDQFTDRPDELSHETTEEPANVNIPPQPRPEPSLFSLSKPAANIAPPHPGSTDLELQAPEVDDLPAVLRRPSGDREAKDRGKWSLKGLFGGDDTGVDTASNRHAVSDEDIINKLTGLGLTPAAIVDDGCIIEASNLRKVKGATAMSEAVAKRLSEPVRHLFMALETNADLKSDIRAFTAQFDARLAPIENDREGIRTRLESDSGRAYLICDAALNA